MSRRVTLRGSWLVRSFARWIPVVFTHDGIVPVSRNLAPTWSKVTRRSDRAATLPWKVALSSLLFFALPSFPLFPFRRPRVGSGDEPPPRPPVR